MMSETPSVKNYIIKKIEKKVIKEHCWFMRLELLWHHKAQFWLNISIIISSAAYRRFRSLPVCVDINTTRTEMMKLDGRWNLLRNLKQVQLPLNSIFWDKYDSISQILYINKE